MNVLIKNCISFLFLFTLIIGCKSDKISENAQEIAVSTPIESLPKAKEKKAEPKQVVEVKKVENDEVLVKVEPKKEIEKPKPAEKSASKPKSVDKPKTNKPKPIKKPKAKPVAKNAKLSFESLTYDFGEIEEGDVFEHKFKFENSGNDTLVVTGADATCGCTTPSYPFIPLLPGDVGYIGVRYNSVGKDGLQQPTITVYTNAEPKIYKLKLIGTVNKKEKEEDKEKEE